MWRRPNGLTVGRMRIPLGVIGIIYESRPNVTADAAALCLKSGNAVILRGGSEAIHSNLAIGRIIQGVLRDLSLPETAIQIVPMTDREAVYELLQLEESIDVIIPRGGEELIRAVVRDSRIPVIKHYKGVCHVFVDERADLDMAVRICMNAKTQRPGVCNAMESLLVHEAIAPAFLPAVAGPLREAGVVHQRLRADAGRSCRMQRRRPKRIGIGSTLTSSSRCAWSAISTRRSPISKSTAPSIPKRSSPKAMNGRSAFSMRSILRQSSSTPPRASATASSWGWGPRSASARPSSTPSGRWGWKS